MERSSPNDNIPWLLGPAWRWRQAKRISRRLKLLEYEDLYPLIEEDATVRAIVELRQHKKTGAHHGQLNPEWIKALRIAFSTYRDPSLRLRLEAFVLAGEPTTDIASRVELAATTVAEYERCFFDVRSRLGARDYILDRVIDCRAELGIFGRQLLKNSYRGGTGVAEYLLKNAPSLGQGTEHDLSTVEGRQREQLELLLLQASIDAQGSLPPYRLLNEQYAQSHSLRLFPTLSSLLTAQIRRTLSDLKDVDGVTSSNKATGIDVEFLGPYRITASLQKSA